jgi:uncharacterized protein (DUF58 family)
MQAADLFKKIRRLEIVSKHLVDSALAGNYLSTFKGTGLEFSEVREYAPGDEVRAIDWNVTARLGKPMLKVFQEERELTVILAVDVSASQSAGSQGSKRELAAQVAAALGLAASRNGDRVGFLFFSDRVEAWLPPKRGRSHLLRGLRDLLALEPEGKKSDFSAAVKHLAWAQRRKAAVFVLSDLLLELESSALSTVSRRHDVVAIRTADKLDEELPAWVGLLAAVDAETGSRVWLDTDSPWARWAWARKRKARLEGARKALRRRSVDLVETRTDGDVGADLLRFFRARERRALA